jgi:FkbM family methyltransferase
MRLWLLFSSLQVPGRDGRAENNTLVPYWAEAMMSAKLNSLLVRFMAALARAVLGRDRFVRVAGYMLDAARFDNFPNEIEADGELLLQEQAVRMAPPGGFTVFDVGANVGKWSAYLLDAADRAGRRDVELHAFEPCSGTFEQLSARLKGHPLADRVRLTRCAMSDKSGSAIMNVMADGEGKNSLQEVDGRRLARREEVPLRTVDEYCRQNGITQLSLMKIDTEGHDFLVLEGASGLLARKAISLAQFEYTIWWMYSRKHLKDVFDLVIPHGYKVGKLTPRGIRFFNKWDLELENFRDSNFLVCREDVVSRMPTAW